MKKSDFEIPDGKLEVFLDAAKELVNSNGFCLYYRCEDCPLDSSVTGFQCDEYNDVINAKMFIKLFG